MHDTTPFIPSPPEHTAQACRTAILLHLGEIEKVIRAAEPTFVEIDEIQAHATLIASFARRLRAAEALVATANHNRLRPLSQVTA